MNKPFLSIVTVTRNHKSGVLNTARSLNEQTCRDFEWIIIDGASTDGTKDLFPTLGADLIISEPDRGIYDAMNKGIGQLNGIYILFLNAGDILPAPDTLALIKSDAQAQGHPEFIYGDALEDRGDREAALKPARSPADLKRGMITHHQAMLYKTDRLKGLRYNLRYKIAADYEFTCRFYNEIDSVRHIPEPLCVFEKGGLSQRQTRLARREQFLIRRDLALTGLPENILIYVTQSILIKLKQHMPQLYWALRQGQH